MPLLHASLQVFLGINVSACITELLCILSNLLGGGKVFSFSHLDSDLVKWVIKLDVQFASTRSYAYK